MKNPEICFVLCFTICVSLTSAIVEWPFGTYTLVKPMSGCPPGWLEGWRHQDNEDSRNKNRITDNHHFYGSFGRNMKFFYCTRDPNQFSGRRYWPSGNYCILRHGLSCPEDNKIKDTTEYSMPGSYLDILLNKDIYGKLTTQLYDKRNYFNFSIVNFSYSFSNIPSSSAYGFQTGSVYWDDEDRNNKNGYGGTLPSGDFGRNTRIDYCCRQDGSYNSTVQLPTSRPFYLLRFTSPCQMVQEMYVHEEIVYFDDEDRNNKNSVSGKYPMGASNERNQRLHYCYYSPYQ